MISIAKNHLIGIAQVFLLSATLVLAILWINYPQGNFEPWTVLGGVVLAYLEILRQKQKAQQAQDSRTVVETGEAQPWLSASRAVTTPGVFRYILDRYLPRIHTWLTTRIGLFELPPEWHTLHDYLSTLRSTIANDIYEKTYVEPHAKDLPEEANRLKAKRTGFLTPIQQLIKEIVGISQGGDAQNAQISAISRKSKFVRNIVKRLLHADEPLILLGDPGTGKSITLQQATMLIAEKESKRLFPKVCLFIRLGEFQVSGEVDIRSVWDYVKKSTPRDVWPFLDSLDDLGRLVIFFDGMDEMSRERYDEYTKALSVFSGSRKGRTKTLFSCRITDFTPRFQHNRLILLPFSRKHIYKYLKRQIPHFPIKVGNRLWKVTQLANRLSKGGLLIQTDNPFVLWLLCTYLQEEQDWPQSRVDLLEYYNRLNYKRKKRDASLRGESMPDMDLAFLTWGRIAYEITERNKGMAIPLKDIEHFLTSEELPAVQAGIQCGVLQKSLDLETTLIRFEHHRFQEYFTAFYLNKKRDEKAALRWLDKLDAPRWQETLFNLVLMGGGQEAIIALDEAIKQGLVLLNELWANRKSSEPAQVETLLADRVELASRILQQPQQQSDKALAKLFATFQNAVYRLSDHGNPITKVKMLLASKIVPGIDIFRVAREPLASNVSWVRQQALIITSVASGEVGKGALKEDVLHSFASGKFLNRFGGFVRIALALKQKRLWCVLVIGLALYLFQLLAGYGLVATARHIVVPTFLATEATRLRIAQRNIIVYQAANDEKKRESLTRHEKWHTQCETVASATWKSLDSWWFLIVVPGAMSVTLLYTLQRAPGHHFLAMQNMGYICLLLPFIWWSLWLGYWVVMSSAVLIVFLPFVVPILSAVNWVLTLLIHVFTLILFVASAFPWTGPVRKKRMLLEAMWENCGFRVWGKITIHSGIPFLFTFFIILIAVIQWKAVGQFIIATFGLLPFFPPIVNIALSVTIYAEILGIVVSLRSRFKRKHSAWKRKPSIFLPWTATCLGLSIVVSLIWGLSLVNWQGIWKFIVATFSLLPFFPPIVNIALSVAIYAEILGCVLSFVSGLKNGWGQSLNLFLRWTRVCLGLAMITFLGWGLYVFSNRLARALALILSFALTVVVLFILRDLMRVTIPFLEILRGPIRHDAGYTSEMWKQELRKLEPNSQATKLRRTTPETFDLPVRDFLKLLQEIEDDVKTEPAQSAYWAKRYEIEQIIRQERSG